MFFNFYYLFASITNNNNNNKKINRGRKSLEARSLADDERIAALEKQLAEAQIIAEDADRRYDEVPS